MSKRPKRNRAPDIRLHDLRHCHASILLEEEESITYIQHRLGHANPAITLSVYSHFIKREDQDAVCRLDNTIFENTGHNC
jgi:integrase